MALRVAINDLLGAVRIGIRHAALAMQQMQMGAILKLYPRAIRAQIIDVLSRARDALDRIGTDLAETTLKVVISGDKVRLDGLALGIMFNGKVPLLLKSVMRELIDLATKNIDARDKITSMKHVPDALLH